MFLIQVGIGQIDATSYKTLFNKAIGLLTG
jgi:hypothetical protein